MQFMIKRLYVAEETVFQESEVKDHSDLAYIIHKKLQNYHYNDNIISNVMHKTEVYVRKDDKHIWQLVFTTTSDEPENVPLKQGLINENISGS